MGRRSDAEVDLVRLYLEEIGREPLLSKHEEGALARIIERGRRAASELASGADTLPPARRAALEAAAGAGERARERFVRANLRLVVSIARPWTRSGVPLLDLIQEGNLGLLRAVDRFDHHRGFRFSTYATWWIRQAISRGVANGGRLVRLPVHTGEALNRVLREQRRHEGEQGGSPTVEALAAGCHMSPERVASLMRLAPPPVSISEPLGEDGDDLSAVLADSNAASQMESALASLVSAGVDRLLAVLGSRERQVLSLRFGLDGSEPRSLDAVGRLLGLSREGVRQSQARALRILRQALTASPESRELMAV